ncbi:spore germination protein [Paenibacillus sp. CF384]|uniref:spore germination protein n=1 Tax=Paenibacillus sp. CF384 TaxID=1884382 RepID=UPI000895008B|nr:spore germination protein [Paenibacillus sp. CF384]SDX82170.1 GerA spore germination protein [Paenibacillus sp. CF384]
MNTILQNLRDAFSGDDDFFLQEETLIENPVVLAGCHSLMDLVLTKLSLQTYVNTAKQSNLTIDELKNVLGEVKVPADTKDLVTSIITGKLLIYFENDGSFVIMTPSPNPINRAIEPPINENVFLGSQNSFTEDINYNIGMLRKQISSDRIRVQSHLIGEEPTKLSLIYYEGHTNMELVQTIVEQIEKNKNKSIENLQQLSRLIIGLPSWTIISKFNQTELPQEAAKFLRKGRAILFVDRLPLALVVPGLFMDIFCMDSDRNLPLPLMWFLRVTRVIGAWLALILPGLYVALVSVNPEVLRIELALSIAQTRSGIPYPSIVEILLMLIIIELVIEASIRLPKNIGPTITMVGGIILGQAVVQAKLVSNLLIIVIAATTIANSTIVGLQQSLALRISKYVIVVMAALFGVLGILEGLVLVCAYLASLNTYGIPYLSFSKRMDEINRG